VSIQALAARLADRAPVLLCESLAGPEPVAVTVEHVAGSPATLEALANLRRSLAGAAPDLIAIWERWDGVRLYAEPLPPGAQANHLVALHPIAEMAMWTAEMREWLEQIPDDDEADPASLRGALVIGGPAYSADCLLVVTQGPRAGAICVFDHETGFAEPFARDAADLLERLAGDPLALIEPFGGTCCYGDGELHPVEYLTGSE
jgi:hypothetical protein